MGILEEMRDILRKSGKTVTLMASLLVVLGLAVGGTVALLFDKTEPVVNTFTPAEVTTTVDETIVGDVKSRVKIENTGDTKAWIRAAVVITWQDKDGNVWGVAPVENTDYTITWNTDGTVSDAGTISAGSWYKGTDGFYYYTSPVATGDTTGVLITSCQPVADKAPTGYNLCVEILGSGIQSYPLNVFNNDSGWATSSGLTASGDQNSQSLSKSKSN